MAILLKRRFFTYQERAEQKDQPKDATAVANPAQAATPPPAPRAPQPVTPPPAPDFLRGEELRTSLSADAVVTGKLSFTAPTRIDGKLKGDVRCTELLVIGATAVVEGSVRAHTVRIEGSVRGEIVDTKKAIIRSGGRFVGRIEADYVVLEDGGYFEGRCSRPGQEAGEKERGVAG